LLSVSGAFRSISCFLWANSRVVIFVFVFVRMEGEKERQGLDRFRIVRSIVDRIADVDDCIRMMNYCMLQTVE